MERIENLEETPVNNAANDLQAYFEQETAPKRQGSEAGQKTSSSFWEASDEDFKTPVYSTPETPEEPQAPRGNLEQPQAPRLTEKAKRGSAATAAGMVDFSNKLLLTPIHTYKLKKKFEKTFSDEQQKLIDDKLAALEGAEISELDAKEMAIKRRFDSMMKKYEKKIGRLEMNQKEKADLENAFYNYFDITEKTLSPGWLLGMALVNSMGSRAIDAFID